MSSGVTCVPRIISVSSSNHLRIISVSSLCHLPVITVKYLRIISASSPSHLRIISRSSPYHLRISNSSPFSPFGPDICSALATQARSKAKIVLSPEKLILGVQLLFEAGTVELIQFSSARLFPDRSRSVIFTSTRYQKIQKCPN